MQIFRLLLAGIVLVGATTASLAQERGRDAERNTPHEDAHQRAGERHDQNSREQNAPGVLALLPADSVTEHNIDLPSGKLAYTATAGTFALFDQNGERSAQIFYTAFVAKSANAAARPVTFAFNGGPGAASAFLNLGLVGPRKRRDQVMNDLLDLGITVNAGFFAPAGLDLGAETPEEIALAIVSEIQRVFAKGSGDSLRERKVAIHQTAPVPNAWQKLPQ